jgi:two-component system sensor histidine kinase AlgZ
LRIEQHRLGERLKTEWTIEDLPDDIHIPPLTLQPVVENAVYHGIQPLEKGGTVSVDIVRINDNLCIRVRNPVQSASSNLGNEHLGNEHLGNEHLGNESYGNNAQGNHLALENIRSRLHLLFGNRASVEARLSESVKGGTREFETLITYPYGGNNHEHTDHR